MKTLVKTLMIAAALATVNVAAFAEEPETTTAKKKSFAVGMYQTINSTKMNLLVEKTGSDKIYVVLKDAKNEVLYAETIAKKDAKYWRKFDMADLKDGNYRFEVSNGKETVVKEISLATEKPATYVPERAISIR